MAPTQLLHYTILESLGQGGMGQVYLAEDTRLHRKVAIKVLSALMASDPERRQRFEREAHAVAALNHPNIVTIYAVEEAGGVPFLVMERVEGRPLSEVIPAHGLPLDAVLRVGIAVSEAIGAAHQRGITHRDLKPGNVMVAADGRVKVLDFGLAKMQESELDAETVTRMPSGDLTGEGRIIGTVAYMSPEQAEGKAVDPRSDIFSLGVMLHEMCTGERPFKGDTNVSVISAILKDTPSSITDLNPRLPIGLAKIIKRALAKDPSRRYQTAIDLRNDLEELKQEIDSGVTMSMTAVRPPQRSVRRGVVWAVAAVVVLVAALAAAWMLARGSRQAETRTAFAIDRFSRLTSTGNAFLAAISADGRYAVHVKIQGGASSLWVRQTATSSETQIVPPAAVRFDGVAYSPDGNYVYYNTYELTGGVGTLYKVPFLGGTPQKILEDVDSAVSFSPDGKQFAFMRGHPADGRNYIMIASADGSGARRAGTVEPPDQLQLSSPGWSPDGRTIIAAGNSLRDGPHTAFFVLDLASGQFTRVGGKWTSIGDVRWLPDGKSFVTTVADLGTFVPQVWEIDFPSGERHRVTNDLNRYNGASLSADARALVTVQQETFSNLWVVPAGGDIAQAKQITSGRGRADGSNGLAWTPDGRIVFSSVASGRPEIWIANADGSEARQLTNDEAPSLQPATSPDNKYVVCQRFRADGMDVWRVGTDGSDARALTRTGSAFSPTVGADGTVYFYSPASGVPTAYKVSIEGGDPVKLSDAYFRPLSVSPDGKLLLGLGWDATARRSALATLPVSGGQPTLLPNIPIALANWLPDGKGLSVGQVRDGVMVILAVPLSGGTPKPLVRIEDNLFGAAWSRDGRLLLARGTGTSDVVLITRAVRTP